MIGRLMPPYGLSAARRIRMRFQTRYPGSNGGEIRPAYYKVRLCIGWAAIMIRVRVNAGTTSSGNEREARDHRGQLLNS